MRAAAAIAIALTPAAIAAALPAGAAAQRTITMSGASPAVALTADLAFFYRREVRRPPRFSLVGGGTATGIADASRDVVTAGLVSRDLAAGDPPGLVLTRIAQSGLCLVTNRANAVPNLTRAQIQDLVAERTVSWAQVPGSPRGEAIVPAAGQLASGARTVFLLVFVDLTTPLTYRPRTFAGSREMHDFISATPAAFGYVDNAFTAGLHVVPYEGVGCSRATIRSGAYPARRPLGFVTRGPPRGELARFIRWIKTSPTARRVTSTRYVPVR